MAGLAVLGLVVLLSLGIPLDRYVAVRAERDRRVVMDRSNAEQAARRDTQDRESP